MARSAKPEWQPDVEFFQKALGFRVGNYGMTKWSDLFTPRQLVALTTFSDLVKKAREQVKRDADVPLLPDTGSWPKLKGAETASYADAVSVYLAFAIDKSAVYWNSLCPWLNQPKNEIVGNSFSRQTVQMLWDYAEANPFCDSGGNILKQLDYVCKVLAANVQSTSGSAQQADATLQTLSSGCVVSFDPPYFDNIGYADLSDFFYVWLRHSLQSVFPGALSDNSRAEGGGACCHAGAAWWKTQRGELLLEWDDAVDESPYGAGASCISRHNVLCIQAIRN